MGPDSYFGLELTRLEPLSHIKLIFDHDWDVQRQLGLYASLDGQTWRRLMVNGEYQISVLGEPQDHPDVMASADGECLSPGFTKTPFELSDPAYRGKRKINYIFRHSQHTYRYIKFQLDKSTGRQQNTETVKLVICELRVIYH
jgi:hypothetical protein